MSAPEEPTPTASAPPTLRREAAWVALLCCLAAFRVWIFSAAFPFFNNLDEQAHFDLVVKYSHAEPPKGLERYHPEAVRHIVVFSTLEYFKTPQQLSLPSFPPPIWQRQAEAVGPYLAAETPYWESRTNYESTQPPLYYALAGAWFALGKWLGLAGGRLLYWVRFLNFPLIAALVWLGWEAARLAFPDRPVLRLCVPLLLAFLPQDVFCGINNDVLSPICFGGAFLCMIKFWQAAQTSTRFQVCSGLLIAAACLTKTSNWPVLPLALVVFGAKARQLAKAGSPRAALPAMARVAVAAAIPLAIWTARNLATAGDLTGSGPKIHAMGWTTKSFSEVWSHPLFTPKGCFVFWTELMNTFWRGELIWHGQRLATPFVDAICSASSFVLLVVAAWEVFRRRDEARVGGYAVNAISLCAVALAVMFLAVLSVAFDFGQCAYPSRTHPYFTSGRLMSGVLVPFAVLFVSGLDAMFRRVRNDWLRLWLVAGVGMLLTISEGQQSSGVFHSAYNWFHLP